MDTVKLKWMINNWKIKILRIQTKIIFKLGVVLGVEIIIERAIQKTNQKDQIQEFSQINQENS